MVSEVNELNERIIELTRGLYDAQDKLSIKQSLFSRILNCLISTNQDCWWCNDTLRPFALSLMECLLESNEQSKLYESKLELQFKNCLECVKHYYKNRIELFFNFTQRFSPSFVEHAFNHLFTLDSNRIRSKCTELKNFSDQCPENDLTLSILKEIHEHEAVNCIYEMLNYPATFIHNPDLAEHLIFYLKSINPSNMVDLKNIHLLGLIPLGLYPDPWVYNWVISALKEWKPELQSLNSENVLETRSFEAICDTILYSIHLIRNTNMYNIDTLLLSNNHEYQSDLPEQESFQRGESVVLLSSFSKPIESLNFEIQMSSDSLWSYLSTVISIFPKDKFQDKTSVTLQCLLDLIYSQITPPFSMSPNFFTCWSYTLILLGEEYWSKFEEEYIFTLIALIQKVIVGIVNNQIQKTQTNTSDVQPSPEIISFFAFLPNLIKMLQTHPKLLNVCDQLISILLLQYSKLREYSKYQTIAQGFCNFSNKLLKLLYQNSFHPQITFDIHSKLLAQMLLSKIKQNEPNSKLIMGEIMKFDVSQFKRASEHKITNPISNGIKTELWDEVMNKFPSDPESPIYAYLFVSFSRILTIVDQCQPPCSSFDPNYIEWAKIFYSRFVKFLSFFEQNHDTKYVATIVSNPQILQAIFVLCISPYNEIHSRLHNILKSYYLHNPGQISSTSNYHVTLSYLVVSNPKETLANLVNMITNLTIISIPPHKLGNLMIFNIVRLIASIIGNANSDNHKLSKPFENILFSNEDYVDEFLSHLFYLFGFIFKCYPNLNSLNNIAHLTFATLLPAIMLIISWKDKYSSKQLPPVEFISICSLWISPQLSTLPNALAEIGLDLANDLLDYHLEQRIVPSASFTQAMSEYIRSPPPHHPKDPETITSIQITLDLLKKAQAGDSSNSEPTLQPSIPQTQEVIDLDFEDISDDFIDSLMEDYVDESAKPIAENAQISPRPDLHQPAEPKTSPVKLKIRTMNESDNSSIQKPNAPTANASTANDQLAKLRLASNPIQQRSMLDFVQPQSQSKIILHQINTGARSTNILNGARPASRPTPTRTHKSSSLMRELRSQFSQDKAQFNRMTSLAKNSRVGITPISTSNRSIGVSEPLKRPISDIKNRSTSYPSPSTVHKSNPTKIPKVDTNGNNFSKDNSVSHNSNPKSSANQIFLNPFRGHDPTTNIQLPRNIFSTTTKKPPSESSSSVNKNNSESSSHSSSEESDKEDSLLNDLIVDSKVPISNQAKSTNTKKHRLYENVYNHSDSDNSNRSNSALTSRQMAARMLRHRPNYDSDVTPLDRVILKWDYNSTRSFPINYGQTNNLIDRSWYDMIPDTFEDVKNYINVFEPLLLLEGWAQIQHSKIQSKSVEELSLQLKSRNRTNDFFDMVFETSVAEGHSIVDNDILVVWKKSNKKNESGQDSHHFMVKVNRTIIKKSVIEVEVRACFDSSIATFGSQLYLDSKWTAKHVMGMTTFYREYLAVKNLASYPLAYDVLKGHAEPLKPLDPQEISDISSTFDVNPPQAHAIGATSLMSEGFSIIQGPPGTGKTKTILGLVGCFSQKLANMDTGSTSLYKSFIKPKILICAPSNAAIDEVVKRLKNGVKTRSGRIVDLKILRVGRLDAIQPAVRDVALEQLLDFSSDAQNNQSSKGPSVGFSARLAVLNDKISEINDFRSKIQTEIDSLDSHQAHRFQSLINKRNEFDQSIKQHRFQISRIYEERHSQNVQMDIKRGALKSKLLAEADVLCCTLAGSGHEVLSDMINHIKVLIIDEAAQSTEPSSLIPLRFNSPLCIMVGDPHQLPPTVISQEATKFQYDYSLFARIYKNNPQSAHLLSIQYRMHPSISEMPSKLFYDGKLTNGPDLDKLKLAEWHSKSLFAPYVFLDVLEGKEQQSKSFSMFNGEEACVAVWLVESLVKQFPNVNFKNRIGVITPYKFQLRELKKKFEIRFNRQIFDSIDFNTIDGFQGQEKDIIIFSAVRTSTSGIGFLSDIRRMNVGLTRAKHSLFIIANSVGLSTNQVWSSIVEDAKARNVYTRWKPNLFEPMDLNHTFPNLIASPPSRSALPKSKGIIPNSRHYHVKLN